MIVDSNILLDLFNPDDPQSEDSLTRFQLVALTHDLHVNHVIFAEVSPRFASAELLASLLSGMEIAVAPFANEDAHRAGCAFRAYRRNGGPRTTILPDFLIGAQAAVQGWPILTRDTKRFASYFPEVELIDPYKANHD